MKYLLDYCRLISIEKTRLLNNRNQRIFIIPVVLIVCVCLAGCRSKGTKGWKVYNVNGSVSAFAEDQGGQMWGAMNYKDNKTGKAGLKIEAIGCKQCKDIYLPTNPPFDGYTGSIRAITFDKTGKVWLIAPDDISLYVFDANNGLVEYQGTGGKKPKGYYGIWSYLVTDPMGQIWVSGLRGDVYTIDPSTNEMSPTSMAHVNFLTEVYGNILVNQYGRILQLENQEWKTIATKELQTADQNFGIIDITISDTGRIWAKSKSGVSVYNTDGSWTDIPFDKAMNIYPGFSDFAVDQSDRVWIGCEGGLWRLDPEKQWVRYVIKGTELVKSRTEQQKSIVVSLKIDSKGMMWVSAGNLVGVLDTSTIP